MRFQASKHKIIGKMLGAKLFATEKTLNEENFHWNSNIAILGMVNSLNLNSAYNTYRVVQKNWHNF